MKRRQLLLAALSLILTICMSFALAACSSCNKETVEPVTLATPVVTIGTDGKASWTAVENASGYAYKINSGDEKSTTETSVTLTDKQSIVVKAVGDGENYLDSGWSTSKTYNASSSGDPNPPEVSYGSLSSPLSVKEALALAADECDESDAYTKEVVYMTGKLTNVPTLKTNSSGDEYYQNLTVADLTDSSKTILVYSINVEENVAAPAQNDVLVVCGYIQNYKGNTIEFTGNGSTYVLLKANTRGTSTITLGAHAGADVTGLPETATNGSKVEFTVAPQNGKLIDAVKVKGEAVTESNGKYSFTVAGNTTVTVDTYDEGTQPAAEIITLDFSDTTYSDWTNNYTNSFTATTYGVVWNLVNLNNGQSSSNWGHVRTGHGTNPITSTISTNIAWADTVTKVIVTVDSLEQEDKVTSFRLEVSSNGNFEQADIVETVTLTIAQGNNEFAIANPVENHFYRLVVDCVKGSANGFVRISKVSYWGHAAEEGGILDPDTVNAGKVASAKNSLKLNPAQYSTLETDIPLPDKSGDVNLVWSVKNTADEAWVSIVDNVMEILQLPDEGPKEILLSVALSLGKASDVKDDIVLTLLPSGSKGTAGNPYTASEALTAAKALGSSGTIYSDSTVYVTGYVIDTGSYSAGNYNNFINVYIADSYTDAKTSNNAIEIYGLKFDETYIKAVADLKLGLKVTVLGYLESYTNNAGTTYQIRYKDSTYIYVVDCEQATDEAKVYFALKELDTPIPNVQTAQNVTLPQPKTVDGVTFVWSSTDSTYTVNPEGTILNVPSLPADQAKTITLTVTAKCGTVSTGNTRTVTITINQEGKKEPVTEPVAFSDLATSYSWETSSGTNVGKPEKDFYLIADIIRFTLTDTDPSNTNSNNSGTWWSSGDMRLYQTGKGCTLTVSAESGYKIVSLKFTYSNSNNGILKYKADNQNYANNTTVSVDSTSAVFEVANTSTGTTGQVRLTAIEVVYIAV